MSELTNLRPMAMDEDAYLRRELTGQEKKRITNGDWLRSLPDVKLVDVIANGPCASDTLDGYFPESECINDCFACLLLWIQKEHNEVEQ